MIIQPKYIIVHDSDSKYGNSFVLDTWHQQRGFSYLHQPTGTQMHIGYHFLILNGRLWSVTQYDNNYDGMVIPCRPKQAVGAHCQAKGHNYDSLGVCLIGPPFTPQQFSALIALLANLKDEFAIPVDRIKGHAEEDPQNKIDPRLNMGVVRAYLSQIKPIGM